MHKTTFAVLAMGLAGAGAAHAQSLTEAWSVGGFASPESAYFDAGSNQIFVSNIGEFDVEDGKISLVSAEGEVLNADWVTGLTDPKGMGAHDGKLYVADATGVHVIDIASGTLDTTIALPGAMFPNDVTVGSDGTVYVSEFFGGGIFRITDGAAAFWMEPGSLPLPNGLLAMDDRMIVGSFGDEMGEGFSVNNPGGLLAVDYETGEVTELANAQGVGSIDGVIALGDMIVYNDNPTGQIFGWANDENIVLGNAGSGAADIGVMGEVILVPNLNTGVLTAYTYE